MYGKDKIELLTCPRCGGVARGQAQKKQRMMIQSWHDKWEEELFPFTIECQTAGCRISITRSEERKSAQDTPEEAYGRAMEAAVKVWNTRKDFVSDAVAAETYRCIEAIRRVPCVNDNETEIRRADAISAIFSYREAIDGENVG